MLKYPVILFDGFCVLCNSTVDFLMRFDRKKKFRYISLQSDTGKQLKQKFDIPPGNNSVVIIFENQVYTESDAIIKITSLLPFPFKMGIILKILPKKFRDYFYRLIAKNRYRWFGKRTNCRIFMSDENILIPETGD